MLVKADRYTVSAGARAAAKQCPKGFACLNGDADLCAVQKCVGGAALFVTCLQHGSCPYQQQFGRSGYLCGCPVRQEIYRTYRK